MTIHIASLFTVSPTARLLKGGLEIAQALGLPVTSWRVGDPTRALFKFLAEVLGAREPVAAAFAKSGFLSSAEGDWLTLLADELYGVERVEATHAVAVVTLTNTGGGYYELAAGDVTVKSSLSGATYHSTSAITLAAGGVGTIDVQADEPGSDGSAGQDEIDELVTTLLGVAITASSQAIGLDEQEDESLREQCRSTLGALSPDGPPDAYEYVARNPDLTGSTEVTRARSTYDSATGDVTVYVASATGAPSGGGVTAVQAAIDVWATPLTITATVEPAEELPVNVLASAGGTGIPATISDDAEQAIGALLAGLQIGSTIPWSTFVHALHSLLVAAGVRNPSVTITSPIADVVLTESQVATVGVVDITEA
jgi:phage-related baseplate assembly protein